MNRRQFLTMLAGAAVVATRRPPPALTLSEKPGYYNLTPPGTDVRVISVHKYGRALEAAYESLRDGRQVAAAHVSRLKDGTRQ